MTLVFDPTTFALAVVVLIGLAIALGLLAAEPERIPVPVPAAVVAVRWRHRRPLQLPRPRPAVLIGVFVPKLKRLAVPVVLYISGVATGVALTGGLLWWSSGPARRVGGVAMTTIWREGTAYLQIRIHGGWQLRVVKATQKQPAVVEADCVVVKVRIRIPDRAFAPLQPEAVITVPEDLVQHPVEVEATDPS